MGGPMLPPPPVGPVATVPPAPKRPANRTEVRRPAAPLPGSSTNSSINICQININGIKGKAADLMHLLTTMNIHVAMVQETKLTEKSRDISTPGYTLVRKDRGSNKGGGLAFLIKENVIFNTNPSPPSITQHPDVEHQSITLRGGINLTINNIYIPPASSCQLGRNLPLQEMLSSTGNDNVITGGDLNAHHPDWHSTGEEDTRGREIANTIYNSEMGLLNGPSQTRVTGRSSSSPDITLASPAILPLTSWRVETRLSSDHLPIIITIGTELTTYKSADKVYTNFSKADWSGFTCFTETKFSNLPPPTCSIRGERTFRRVLNSAAKKFIPQGRINNIHHNVPTNTAKKIKERDHLRSTRPDDARLDVLNREIAKEIQLHRSQQWQKHLDSCEQGSQKLWKTIKGICQPTKTVNNTALKFNGGIVSENGKIANLLNRQYTPSLSKPPTKQFRQTIRKIKKKRGSAVYQFTASQVKEAIMTSKSSKAMGPDNISPIMLKHLGDKGMGFLAGLINTVLNTSIVPTIWKAGKIIPLLKPGKPIDEGKSYRPISLLSPAAKIMEKLILPELSAAVKLQDHQHGFRKNRSTVTALQEVNFHIASGLNRRKPPHRTILVAVDLSRAFDTVDHELLLKDILQLEVSDTLIKFLCSYLRGRQQHTIFRNCKSKCRVVRQGVPQGGVLSPLLFNLYMSSLPKPPGNIKLISYADDCQVLHSGPTIEETCHAMTPYLDQLAEWFKGRGLELSQPKSTATVFTTFSGEAGKALPITIQGEVVPTIKHPKVLGVTFDNMHKFGPHVANIRDKVAKRNSVLKCLAGTTWGKSKEILLNTYKAIGRSVLNYAAPVWSPFLSSTNWDLLNTTQNVALRAITGCTKMSAITHLNQETGILPVREHNIMLTEQFLLSMHRQEHPNNHLLTAPTQPRKMRPTIIDHLPGLEECLRDEDPAIWNYKQRLKQLHDGAHKKCNEGYPPNKILGTTPPPLNNRAERSLGRSTRRTLAQLRSGYSPLLASYRARIEDGVSPLCVDCGQEDQTTDHLFKCQARPTDLAITDLWAKPDEVAAFLGLTEEE